MLYVFCYFATLISFGAMDAVWLGSMTNALYRPTLGDILLPSLRVAPAIAFYLVYPIGVVVFAVLPALKDGSLPIALVYGALFGALAYATYDLTNFATLRNWNLQITVLDAAWGTLATSVAAGAAYYATRLAASWLGSAA